MPKVSPIDVLTNRIKEKRLNNFGYLVGIPLLLSLAITALFYPGFMSYDTLHALRGARNGVIDSMWPPMVSYVWRAVDSIVPHPSAMHFSQVFLLLFSFYYLAFVFSKRIKYATTLILIYLGIPIILGSIAVIWKDVLMAAFFLSGFAAIVAARRTNSLPMATILSAISLVSIFLGVCSRHNAIAGAVPLLFHLSWVAASRAFKTPGRIWLTTVLVGALLTGGLFNAKIILDKYSLPHFTEMKSSASLFIETVRIMDVAGASVCAGRNLFGELAPDLSLDEIKAGYHPRHINLSIDLVNKVGINPKINKIWLNVAKTHPICFFNNKFQLTKHLTGANNKTQYIVTAASIIENEYGYALPRSPLRDEAASYISHASWLPLFKPWFLYLISTAAFIFMLRRKTLTSDYLALYASAIFYFGSLVVFGNAADGRLSFYTNTAVILFLFVSVIEYKKAKQARGRPTEK